MGLQFCIHPIIIDMLVYIVAFFQDKGLDILVLHVTKYAASEVAVMFIEENYFIVDSGGAA